MSLALALSDTLKENAVFALLTHSLLPLIRLACRESDRLLAQSTELLSLHCGPSHFGIPTNGASINREMFEENLPVATTEDKNFARQREAFRVRYSEPLNVLSQLHSVATPMGKTK